GSGLGLAIVQRVAEAHQGEVRLAAAAGGGTQATLWLPAISGSGPLSMDPSTPQG
ncbi:MAG: ATP-binding protein, partial [Actinomycetota bacterium]|nr:ATP-binding protein [Actinomycetota bacterium]